MASTRELWILLKARDEASRVVSSFSKNVRAAALSAQAAQKSAEAAAIRQQAQMLKTNGATAQQIRTINDSVIQLEKQARAQTAAAARAREYRAEQMKGIDAQVRSNNVHAAGLERQARALTLASNMADEHRTSLARLTGGTNEQVAAIDNQIAALRKRAATLNSEAAVARGASASLIAGLQQEQTGLDGSIRSYERRAAAIRAQAAILRNSAQEMTANLNNQVRALTNNAAALDKQANSLRQAANAAREHDTRMRALTQNMQRVGQASAAMALGLAAVGVGGLVGLKSAVDTTVEYERQVRATATQVGNFQVSLKELGDIGKRIANQIAVPFEQIQPALFDVFSSMDVGVKDAEKLLTAFSKAAVAGQTDIQAVSRATVGILNAFHRPASDVNKILDIQFQLVKLGIGTYEEWNQRIGLVTPSAVRAGQSIEMMAAALATSTRMGISAARSGTAVSRAMDAISHPAAVKNMEELGIKVRDASGKFRPMNKILREFRDALMKLPEKDRVAKILEVFKGAGGTIEARRFLQNILLGKGNLEAFDSVLKRVEDSSGSMEDAYKTMADSTAAKSELMRNKWQLLKQAIGDALIPTFNDLLDTISGVMDAFNRLPQGTQNTIAQFLLWGSVLSLVLAGMFAVIAGAAILTTAIGTIGVGAAVTIGVLTLLPVALLAIGVAFVTAYKNSETFRSMVKGLGDTLKELWGIVTSTAQNIKDSFDANVLPPLKRVGDTIKNDVLPPVRDFADMVKNEVLPKIQEAARIIGDLADGALKQIGDVIDNTVNPALQKLGDWWDKNGEKMRPFISQLGQLMKWSLIVAAVISGVLAVVLIGPLVAAFAVAAAAVQLFFMALTTISDGAKQAWDNIQKLPAALSAIGSSIGSFFSSVGQTISSAFQSVMDWFQQLPGRIGGFLAAIPGVVANAFTTALNQAAYAVGYGLGLIYVFFTQVIPKVGSFLAGLPGKLVIILSSALHSAASAVGTGIDAVLKFFRDLPRNAAEAAAKLWSSISGHFSKAATGASSKARELVDGYIKFMRELPGKVGSALSKVPGAVTGAFAGAAGWLIGAGEDIIRGVIGGIGNMIGGAVDAARNAAHKMVQGFKDAIKSKSPSKVFIDIGYNIIRGLIIGITGTRKQLINAMDKIAHDVMASLNAGKASSSLKKTWSKRLSDTTKSLLSLESKRAGINARLASTQKSLNDQLKARSDLMAKITEKLSSGADILDLQGSSPKQLVKNLQTRLTALQDFSRNLTLLKTRGLNKETIAQLAEAGVESAGGLVSTLAKADNSELNKINDLQKQIRSVAAATGNSVAGQMYDAGIQAARGLIKGLESQSKAITKQMEKIANSLISSIKKSLGIKSPSKVFEGIGINTALGYIRGYQQQMSNATMHSEMLNLKSPRYQTATSGGSGTIGDNGRTFHQTINVYTNEIDPRLTAAELGYELEGRIR